MQKDVGQHTNQSLALGFRKSCWCELRGKNEGVCQVIATEAAVEEEIACLSGNSDWGGNSSPLHHVIMQLPGYVTII